MSERMLVLRFGPRLVEALQFSVAADQTLVGRFRKAGDVRIGRQRNRHGWFVRGLSLCDLFNEGCNLVGRLGHVLRAIMQRNTPENGLASRGRRFLSFTLSRPAFGVGVRIKG